MRYALHSRLKPGHEDEYDRDHGTVPDGLVDTFTRVGIRNWTIWRSGSDLFHLVDMDDYDAAMAALDTDAANATWQQFIGRHVDGFALIDGDLRLPLVWDFATQRDS